jgi:hypothetical protein
MIELTEPAIDVFGQDRSENGLAWLVGSSHCGALDPDVFA